MASNSPTTVSKGKATASLVAATLSSPSSRTSSPRLSVLRSNLGKRNRRGETQLHLAAQRGDIELVRRALESGVDVNSADNAGWTPLHEACICEKLNVAELLLASGADPNKLSNDGTAPLVDAVQCGNESLVSLLLKHGAIRREEMKSLSNSAAILSLLESGEIPPSGSDEDGKNHQQDELVAHADLLSSDQTAGSNVEQVMESEAAEEDEAADEEGVADPQTPDDSSQLDLRLPVDCCPSSCPLEEESNLDLEGEEEKNDGVTTAEGDSKEEGQRQSCKKGECEEDNSPGVEAVDVYDFHSEGSVDSESVAVEDARQRNKDPALVTGNTTRRAVSAKELLLPIAPSASPTLNQDNEYAGKGGPAEIAGSILMRSTAAQKVPPLRILIPRTASEDPSDANASPSSQSRHSGSANSPVDFKSTSTAKPKAESSTQILTRSRVRQTGIMLDGNVKHYPRTIKRKREQQLTVTTEPDGEGGGGAGKSKLLRCCQTEHQTRAASEGVAENLLSTLFEVDQQQDDEESTRSANDEEEINNVEEESTSAAGAADGAELDKVEPMTTTTCGAARSLSPPILNILERSSLRQSLELRRMIESRWTRGLQDNGQKIQLISNVTCPEEPSGGPKKAESSTSRTSAPEGAFPTYYPLMPEELKVHADSIKRRRDGMAQQHAVERERLLQFADREQNRLLGRFNNHGGTAGVNICRMLRDVEVYNPLELDEHGTQAGGSGPLSSDGQPSNIVDQLQLAKNQLAQRLKYMATTLRNRHAMEAGSLHVCQQAEWEKTMGTMMRAKSHKGDSQTQCLLLETLANSFHLIFPPSTVEQTDLHQI